MSNKPFDPRNIIYTPAQVASYGLKNVDDLAAHKGRGVDTGITSLEGYFAPVMPGQVCAVLGQTSHYKSGMLQYLEHHLAEKLMADPERKDEIIVHLSVEDVVEEQSFTEFAHYSGLDAGAISVGELDTSEDWEKLRRAAIPVSSLPIYRIGDSIERSSSMERLHLSHLLEAVEYLRNESLDWHPRIAAIFLDYLQALPFDDEIRRVSPIDQRRLQVAEDVDRLFSAARYFRCPVFVAVQAKQDLKEARPPVLLPDQYDGLETSTIATRFDRILTLWMPKKTMTLGETFTAVGRDWTVADNMLWIKVAKQRGRFKSGGVFPCVIDYTNNVITPDPRIYDLRRGSPERSRYAYPRAVADALARADGQGED